MMAVNVYHTCIVGIFTTRLRRLFVCGPRRAKNNSSCAAFRCAMCKSEPLNYTSADEAMRRHPLCAKHCPSALCNDFLPKAYLHPLTVKFFPRLIQTKLPWDSSLNLIITTQHYNNNKNTILKLSY